MISAFQDEKDMDKADTPYKHEKRPNVLLGVLGIIKEGHNLQRSTHFRLG